MVAQQAIAEPQLAAAGSYAGNTASVGGSNSGGTVIG